MSGGKRAACGGIALSLLILLAAGVAAALLHLRVSPVLSGSMRPAYRPGDAIVTRLVPVQSVHPGMIVEFVPPGSSAPYAHRVVSVTGPANHPVITTKGDANPVADPWHARLAGPTVPEVVAVIPAVGRLLVGSGAAKLHALLLIVLGLITTGFGASLFTAPKPAVPAELAAAPNDHR